MTYTPDGMLMTELANARRELQAMRGLVRELADALEHGDFEGAFWWSETGYPLIARAKAALSGDVP